MALQHCKYMGEFVVDALPNVALLQFICVSQLFITYITHMLMGKMNINDVERNPSFWISLFYAAIYRKSEVLQLIFSFKKLC